MIKCALLGTADVTGVAVTAAVTAAAAVKSS